MSDERWEPVPVPFGDGRHDIGDDTRAAIFNRLHDDFAVAAPWMTAEQRRQLAMLAAASVRALLHELGTLRDLTSPPASRLDAPAADPPKCPARGCVNAARISGEGAPYCEACWERIQPAPIGGDMLPAVSVTEGGRPPIPDVCPHCDMVLWDARRDKP